MAQPQEETTPSEEPVPPWWERNRPAIVVIGLFVLALLGMIFASNWNSSGWEWTGFGPSTETTTTTTQSGETKAVKDVGFKTLWDWLQLLFVPVVIGAATYWFQRTEQKIEQKRAEERARLEKEAANRRADEERQAADKRAETERALAEDAQRDTALQAYLNSMTELLLGKGLRASTEEEAEVRVVARTLTLTALHRLDGIRKDSVVRFLHEAGLIDKDKAIVRLRGADLSRAHLTMARLEKASLEGAHLQEANLVFAVLIASNLRQAWLRDADLRRAWLLGANLEGADLNGADLNGANLKGATVTLEQLATAKSLEEAIMPDGTKYAGVPALSGNQVEPASPTTQRRPQ